MMTEIERLYKAIDTARKKAGLSVPVYRDIKEFKVAKKKYIINFNDMMLFVLSDKININGYDYMRYVTAKGNRNIVYALYFKNNKPVEIADAGILGIHNSVVWEYYM